MQARRIKGAQIVKAGGLRQRSEHLWLVPSQSHQGTWMVDYENGKPSCTCPDFEKRSAFCKHIFAIEIYQSRMAAPPDDKKATYTQDWPAYNAAQMNEEAHFLELLHGLCAGIQSPVQTGKGRPATPLATMVFACVMKVYGGFSGRRATSQLARCAEQGLFGQDKNGKNRKAPHYNTISDTMNDPTLTPLLRTLLQESASPMAGVETHFSPDSTGFPSTTYDRWFDEKWGKARKRAKFRKVHAICGRDTHIVTDLLVNERGDPTQFKALVDATGQRFNITEVSADKAYLSKANFEYAAARGFIPYIPFKEGITGKGPALWAKMFHFFRFKREDFDGHYHGRSNIETVFSMVKRKFVAAVRSKTRTAQTNEIYCKFLCHNITVLIASIYELGLQPEFWTGKETA